MPYQSTYTPPVEQLLTLGEKSIRVKDWSDYRGMGIGEQDIPELIRMATDEELLWAPSTSKRVWAPIHAWRALGELHAEAAIDPLLGLFPELADDDWLSEVMPSVFGLIGPAALPALTAYLADATQIEHTRIVACEAIWFIAGLHPEAVDRCARVLHRQLMRFESQPKGFNGFLIMRLVNIGFTGVDSLMKLVFQWQAADESFAGDYRKLHQELFETDPVKREENQSYQEWDFAPLRQFLAK
ncbi:MAG: HEAT repeat domain-containing protein [Armatimonadota bacterium]